MLFDVHTHNFDKSSNALYNLRLSVNSLVLNELNYFSAGVHPYDADKFDGNTINFLKQITAHKNCLAIGEIGIDKRYGLKLELQQFTFEQQANLANELAKPVILHCVKAWNEIKTIKHQIQPTSPWIYHGFTKAGLIDSVLENGCYISIGASILTNKSLQNNLYRIPLDRLFLETDDHNGPISEIYKKVAELKKIELYELEIKLEKNIRSIFTTWIIG